MLVPDEDLDIKAKTLVDRWIQGYRRGSLRFFILHLLLHEHHHKDSDETELNSFHGYKISKKIDEVTKGKWRPTTASIYPILKELSKVDVVEKIPGVEQKETGRTTIEYRLTPFGLQTAKKLEEARKEFAKAFIAGKKGEMPPPLFPFGRHLPPEEAKEILRQASDEALFSHRNQIKERMRHTQKHLKYIENELKNRKKKQKDEED